MCEVVLMNSRLAKIAIEMQLEETNKENKKYISLNVGKKNKLFSLLQPALVTVPVDKK